MKIKPFGKVFIPEIENYSDVIGFKLPEIYSYFLTQTNGGTVEEESFSFTIEGTQDKILLEKFYGFDLPEDDDIVVVNNKYNKDLPPNSLIIGYGSEGYFILVNNDVDSLLYYWDVDSKLDVSNEESNAYLISNSFSTLWNELGEIYINKGEINMEKIKYAPLGSIILLNGSFEKIIIIGRGLIVKNAIGNNVIFDYAGVTYPEGLVGDQVAYFNHKDIAKVVFEGFSDEADIITVNNINTYIETHPEIEKGTVETWN